MPSRINIHNRVVQAIGIQIKPTNRFRIQIFNTSNRHKPAGFRIVISRLKEIQLRFRIIVIRTVSERIKIADMVYIREKRTVIIHNRHIAPCVIKISCDNCTAFVDDCKNVVLHVFSIEIRVSVVYYASNTRMVVEELQTVALLY